MLASAASAASSSVAERPGEGRCDRPTSREALLSPHAATRKVGRISTPHIGAVKQAVAKGAPRNSARSPMQPPMECASMW